MIQALDRQDLDTFLRLMPVPASYCPPSAFGHLVAGEGDSTIDNTYSGSQENVITASEDTIAPSSGPASVSSPCTITTQPRTSPTPPLACACLAACYLTLNDIRENNELSFPSGLHVLRKSMATATQMAHCQSCPTRYLSALQNVQLLIALIMTMAKQYGSILESIENEVRLASGLKRSKLFRFGAVVSDDDACFTLEASPLEWRSLANRAVKGEVFGVRDGGNSFWALLDFLEKRQTLWHTAPPNSDHPREYTVDPDPLCIKLLREARGVLEGLKF